MNRWIEGFSSAKSTVGDARFEKVDDYTVKIYLSQSFGAFISNLAHPATLIMSPKQIEAGEDACAQAPVGTGQYKFVEWVAAEQRLVGI